MTLSASPSPAAPVSTAVAAAPPRPWLARLHPSLFGMALGLLGLAGAWLRLGRAGLAGAQAVGDTLLEGALALLALMLVLWIAKLLRHGDVLRQEWRHPVQGALLALMPVATMMAVALVAGRWPALLPAMVPVAAAVLIGQAVMAWHVVADLSTGKTPPEWVTPALYLPTVPGGFVGAMALEALGLHGWASLLMGMGLGAWALLEMRILNRLFAGPLPPALRPTLGIEMAPAAVGSLAVCALWPALPADALMVMLGLASGPVLAVLTRWRYWSEVPFNVGFWSFSFPLAAFASTTVEAVRRGDWPLWVGTLAVAVASAVIAYLLARTLVLLVQGRLLPPV
jgi:tellurite resistance protein